MRDQRLRLLRHRLINGWPLFFMIAGLTLGGMMLVEPLVADLVDDIYREYIQIFEKSLERSGSNAPRAEALLIMSMVEGTTLFIGKGRPWSGDNDAVLDKLREFINGKYNNKT